MKKTGWFLWSLVGLVWLVVSLPVSDYSLTALFEIPESPPRSHDGLKALLEHIIYASNASLLSGVLLYGLNRGWYRGGDYPAFLRRLDLQARFTHAFQNPPGLRCDERRSRTAIRHLFRLTVPARANPGAWAWVLVRRKGM